MSLQGSMRTLENMKSTDSDEIQQIVADALRGRPSSRGQDVDDGIIAVITVERDRRFLSATLRSVFAQTVLPATIIVADCSGVISEPLESTVTVQPPTSSRLIEPVGETHVVRVRLVGVTQATSFSDAVRKAVSIVPIDGSARGLWMLHDDARPVDDRCLERLLETWRNAPTASILGCKQLDWQGQRLHDVGSYACGHQVVSLVVDGEQDQEQYDNRSDVFAVSLAGALVSLATLHTLRWPDPWFGTYRESADFCRRVCLSGGRVVVVPQAGIAHRRSRFEGIRSRAGEPLDEDAPTHTVMQRMSAVQRYRYTDMHRTWWPMYWLWSLITALWSAVRLLFAKQPYDAWCALRLPWLGLGSLSGAWTARGRIRRQSVLTLSRLPMLVANRHQVALWHDRDDALSRQRGTRLLGPLAQAHLRRRAIRRFACAAFMALIALMSVVVSHYAVVKGMLAGGSLSSDQLLPTSANFAQLLQSATTPWVFGLSTGVPAPPAPWLLVWSCASLFTLGHVSAALSLLYIISAPLSALSFWALAGVFTRSDAIRVVCGLLWSALSIGLGLYDTANLAMLTVMIFLPAAFAFVFRAVGMYHTEDLVRPRFSVQAAGCSALCFIPVVLSEPQLLLPLILVFLVFLVLIPRHRGMLLLIPVPAAFVVAPTLVNAAKYGSRGLWRQLFGDITVPLSSHNGVPSALNLADIVWRAFGLGHGAGMTSLWSLDWLTLAILGSLLLLVALAIVSLFLPFALRVSRMMWTVVVFGALLSMASARVVIAVDGAGPVAGSVDPGMSLVILGLLCCGCQVAGGAVSRYHPLALSLKQKEESHSPENHGRVVAVHAARASMTVLLILCAGIWTMLGITRTGAGRVSSTMGGLPMVAVDYLDKNSAHRVLALRADSRTTVSYTVLRTAKGDLIDASPAQRAQQVSGMADPQSDRLAAASARLLANADADAIEDIAGLGFGGIYVVGSASSDGESAARRDAATELSTNITASEGVQSVVSNASGTYYRVTAVSDNTRTGVDTSRQRGMQISAWRYVWLWSMGIVVLLYCLVALPRARHGAEEEL